jgi:hypothetical protein
MRSIKTTLFFLFLTLPFFLAAQDYVGSWNMPGMLEDGTKITNTVTMKADGTMTVDFGSDGAVDVNMTYTVTDGVISMTDHSKESPCHGTVGKYRIAVSGDTMTATLVDDPCDARRGDGSKMVMTRKR